MDLLQRRLLPSISALTAFDAVVRRGSFSAAAQELALTQGAISRQVAALEKQLGIALFERNSRQVTLTPVGETYAQSISKALRLIRSSSLDVMTRKHGVTLNLAMLPTFGTRWLIPRIPGFVEQHPDIILNFSTRIGQFDIEAEGMDAVIHVGAPDWPGAESTFLMHEYVAPVCSPIFMKEHKIKNAKDMKNTQLLRLISRAGAWEHWYRSLGMTIDSEHGMQFEHFSTLAQACIAGLGIALMPLFLIKSELKTGQLIIAYDHKIESNNSYYLIIPRNKLSYEPVCAFKNWLTSQIAAKAL